MSTPRMCRFVNHDLAGYEVRVHADIRRQEVIFLGDKSNVCAHDGPRCRRARYLRGRRGRRQCGVQCNRRAHPRLSPDHGQNTAAPDVIRDGRPTGLPLRG